MANYIGKVQVGDGDIMSVGSTLFGVCGTAADTTDKVATLADFTALMNGITVHIKFTNGNNVLDNVTLRVGGTLAQPVSGNCICAANEVVSFTLEQSGTSTFWRAERGVKIETDSNIITKIDGQEVNAATKDYVDSKTAGLDGLTGAMHFRGTSTTVITDGGTENPTVSGNVLPAASREAGDVVIYGDQEYVWNGSRWELLGDEGSYALKTSTASVGSASGWQAGKLPTLGTEIPADDITGWDQGTASNATVTNGVLKLTNSTTPTLNYTAKSIPNVTDAGTLPSLTVSSTTVVVP